MTNRAEHMPLRRVGHRNETMMRWREIVRLHREGRCEAEIARVLNLTQCSVAAVLDRPASMFKDL